MMLCTNDMTRYNIRLDTLSMQINIETMSPHNERDVQTKTDYNKMLTHRERHCSAAYVRETR